FLLLGCLCSNEPAPTHHYTLSLHDALPILPFSVEVNWKGALRPSERGEWHGDKMSFIMSHGPMSSTVLVKAGAKRIKDDGGFDRSEEHTSELQSRENLVCRLLLEKKKRSAA